MQKQKHCQNKQIREKSGNIHTKNNILIPNSNMHKRANILMTKGIPSENIKKILINNNAHEKSRNKNKNKNTALEDKILMKRPQIRIKMNSLKHNNKNRNSISSEKSNSKIKCKVHKIKPETAKNKNINSHKRNKINYNIADLNKEISNLTQINDINDERRKREDVFIAYYNYIQEQSIQKLSSHLDTLIIDQNKNKSKKDFPEERKYSNLFQVPKTNVYRKIIQRKKNWYKNSNDSFQNDDLLCDEQKDFFSHKNNQEILYDQKINSIKKRIKMLPNLKKTHLNNGKSGTIDWNKNNLILMTSLSHNNDSKINMNLNMNMNNQSEIRRKDNYFNFNFDNIQNRKLLKHHFTDLRFKKNYNIGTPKLNNVMINSNDLNDFSSIRKENTLNLEYYLAKNENNNFGTNNGFTLYSSNTSEYNTVNTLNNSEKKYPFKSNLSGKKIYIKKPLSGKKSITYNNSKKKTLINVVTSIEYANGNNKKSNNILKDKIIILSEVDSNGKINIKIKKNKNCIEKVLRNNSINKSKNKVYLQKK